MSNVHAQESRFSGIALLLLVLVLAVGIGLTVTRCGSGGAPSTGLGSTKRGEVSTEDVLRRERAVSYYEDEEYDNALAQLGPLTAAEKPLADDLVTEAQILLRQGDTDGALASVLAALEAESDHLGALYTRARLSIYEGELEDAVDRLRSILDGGADDPASKIELARTLYLMEDYEATLPEQRRLLDEVIDLGLPNGVQWYVTAVYRRWRIALESEEEEEVVRHWETLWDELSARGYEATSELNLDQGTLARVTPPEPFGSFPPGPPDVPTFGEPTVVTTFDAPPDEFLIRDVDGNRTPDVLAVVGRSLVLHVRDAEGSVTGTRTLLENATGPFLAFDLNQRRGGDTLDVVAATEDGLAIVEQSDSVELGAADERAWEPSPVELPAFDGAVRDLEIVDFDHDGDLDLFVVGDFGARLLSNDGVGAAVDDEGRPLERGTWTDVSERAGLTDQPLAWCYVEDFDGDNDVDLIAGGPGRGFLYDSLRRGLFRDVSANAFGDMGFPREPAIADLDGDARPDLFVPDASASVVLRQEPDGSFRRTVMDHGVPAGRRPVVGDVDLNGAVDVLWGVPNAFARGVLGIALDSATLVDLPALDGAGGPFALAEMDAPDPYGTLGMELVRVRGADLVSVSPTAKLGNAVYLKYIGDKDNRQGVGAVLEVRKGDRYRRIYLRGTPEVVGIGGGETTGEDGVGEDDESDADAADVVRITWPNGVVDTNLDVATGVRFFLDNEDFGVQPEGLIGSCPFLYTWNGETFEFISDVLGITPLGLPMAPGMLVPPDHDEYVLVRGDQLKPDANGELVLQFTEELREVTYLDRLRLDAVDHPSGTAIYPNERFKFPPFPKPHTHVVERVAKVARATGSDGWDWTAELQAIDSRHPRPFRRLAGQFLGLAEPHYLELEFDPDALEGAETLRLVATGWFYWSDASANVAAATTPGIEFVPPTIEVQGPDGQWSPAGPPIGFPAGKTKTMVVDVTDVIPRDDPRIRISSTLELYWDCIEIATCDDDAPVDTHPLDSVSTELWSRGFSEAIAPDREDLPLLFDWDRVAKTPRWNQHPGNYTKYGSVNPLLEEIDDQYVIMGSGDALTVRFDASELPPVPEGYVRDYLVFLDGWAKDRDPNTHEALDVEPLPFHGMSGYPYPDDESFPDTPEHRAWREEWNTRAAHGWIVPLSPIRAAEWGRARPRVGSSGSTDGEGSNEGR